MDVYMQVDRMGGLVLHHTVICRSVDHLRFTGIPGWESKTMLATGAWNLLHEGSNRRRYTTLPKRLQIQVVPCNEVSTHSLQCRLSKYI